MSLQALSNITHRDLKYQHLAAPYGPVKNKVLASLVIFELSHALRDMPIVFTFDNDRVGLVGLMGLSQDENLFIDRNGAWLGGYIPAVLRAAPFGLAKNGEEQTVVIDPDGSHFNGGTGIALFNDEGAPGEFLVEMLNFLRVYQENVDATAPALAAIAAAGILAPWQLNITAPDGKPRIIGGLFQADMAKFGALSEAEVATLHRSGALAIIYAHVFSLHNVAKLEKMAREQEPVIPSTIEFNLLKEDYLKF